MLAYPLVLRGVRIPGAWKASRRACRCSRSDVSSLPEVTGDAAMAVDPRDERGDRRGHRPSCSTTRDLRAMLSAAGLTSATRFTWEATARARPQALRAAHAGSARVDSAAFLDPRDAPRTIHGRSHVLVTGGAGFIGSHLVDALLERGDRVTVLDRLSAGGSLANLEQHGAEPRLTFVHGDVCDAGARRPARGARPTPSCMRPRRPTSIAASTSPPTFLTTNVLGTADRCSTPCGGTARAC